MSNTTQAGRLIKATTPLGPDVLLAVGFTGQEAISLLYRFNLDARAERTKTVAFEKLIGHPVTVALELPAKKVRYFHGICSRVTQGESDPHFTNYKLEIVPQFWLLTRSIGSRIFQQMSIPDILKKVLAGLDTEYQFQGTYNPREYCVQYRESDFAFASRLMEEEGIFYFFKHTDGGCKMVVADTPAAFKDLPDGPAKVTYKNGPQEKDDADVITEWEKSQELATGKFTRWDHTFEIPHDHLEQERPVQESAKVGGVTHKLTPPTKLEAYDWPGGYAKRYDMIDKGGGDQSAELEKIRPDGKRMVEVLAQREAAARVVATGIGHCRHFTTGHKFTVETLATDLAAGPIKADGIYLLTEVTHAVRIGDNLRSGEAPADRYDNRFSAIPLSVPFRPARVTQKPVVHGVQSAQVVGPPGEEIFTDKFGRVKVQFHWDREGKRDASSSCWIRVASAWAGRGWGIVSTPRIGQEVVVDFLEGDPDQPIIVGSVHNPDQMPAYKLPDNKTRSWVKSNTSPGGVGFNEFRLEDKKGQEQIFVHAERNMDERVKNDRMERVIHDRHLIVGWEKDGNKGGDQREQVYQDKHLHVLRHQVEQVEGNLKLTVGKGEATDGGNLDVLIEKDKKELIEKNDHLHVKESQYTKVDKSLALTVGGDQSESVAGKAHLEVKADRNEKVGGTQSLTVGMNQQEKVGQKHALEAGQEIHLKAGMKVIIEAGVQLTLKGPGGFVDIGPSGVTIQGTMVLINSGGAAGSGSGSSPTAPAAPAAPQDAVKAEPTKPAVADDSKTGEKSCK